MCMCIFTLAYCPPWVVFTNFQHIATSTGSIPVAGQNNSGCHGSAQAHATHVNDILVAAPNQPGIGQGDQEGIRKVL